MSVLFSRWFFASFFVAFLAVIPAAAAPLDPARLVALETSAAAGDEKAQLNLAHRYLDGNGVEADLDKSLFYYRLAAARDIAYAQHRLARLYLDGRYLEPQPIEAERWLLQAAGQGYVPAQLDLSQLYETRAGDASDRVSALAWVLIAESLSDSQLDQRIEALSAELSYLERARATLSARLCILRGYEGCTL